VLASPAPPSSSLPPIALGALVDVLLCEMYHQRPIENATMISKTMPITHTQRDKRFVPLWVLLSQELGCLVSSFAMTLNLRQKSSPLSPLRGRRASSELPRMMASPENFTSLGAGEAEGRAKMGVMGVIGG